MEYVEITIWIHRGAEGRLVALSSDARPSWEDFCPTKLIARHLWHMYMPEPITGTIGDHVIVTRGTDAVKAYRVVEPGKIEPATWEECAVPNELRRTVGAAIANRRFAAKIKTIDDAIATMRRLEAPAILISGLEAWRDERKARGS